MADFVIERSTYTFRKTFISKWCGNPSVRSSIFIDQFIDLGGTHTLADMFCNMIQYSRVKLCTLSDSFDLFCCLYDLSWRSNMSFTCQGEQALIHSHMTFLIFLAAAAPAQHVSFHNHQSSSPCISEDSIAQKYQA